jgi:hypothetical protein
MIVIYVQIAKKKIKENDIQLIHIKFINMKNQKKK